MENIIEKLIDYKGWWAIYLGGSLSAFTNVSFTDWQFYAIIIPVSVLVGFCEHD